MYMAGAAGAADSRWGRSAAERRVGATSGGWRLTGEERGEEKGRCEGRRLVAGEGGAWRSGGPARWSTVGDEEELGVGGGSVREEVTICELRPPIPFSLIPSPSPAMGGELRPHPPYPSPFSPLPPQPRQAIVKRVGRKTGELQPHIPHPLLPSPFLATVGGGEYNNDAAAAASPCHARRHTLLLLGRAAPAGPS